MDSIWNAISLLKPGCYTNMASIGLKEAYYSVPIHPFYKNYLTFCWGNFISVFPNGLALRPEKYTKLLKLVFSHLRQQHHVSVAYLADPWLAADDYNACINNVVETLFLLDRLGFVVNLGKSVLILTQEIVFLGFI